MRHLKLFEAFEKEKKVYWIVPFDERFEDVLVTDIFKNYVGWEDEYKGIEQIDRALGISNDARNRINKSEPFVLVTMRWFTSQEYDKLRDEWEEVIHPPYFHVEPLYDKEKLDSEGYIYIGMLQTDKEEFEIKMSTTKYNL